jgi:branched-chain amino acid transport system permease protein
MTDLFQFLVSGFTIGSIYALVGLGYYLVFISTRVINFAHGALVQLGGVMALSLLVSWSLAYPAVFLVTFFIMASVGVLFEKFLVSPAGREDVLTSILMTVGGFIFFEQVIYVFWTKDELLFPAISGDRPLDAFGIMIMPQALWILGITVVVLVLLWLFFSRTIHGSAMMAAAEKPEAALLMGVSVRSMSSLAWGLATGLAALAGILIAPITFAGGSLSVEMGIKGFVAAVLGGITSAPGVVVGGLLLGIIEALTTGYVSSGWKDAISFALLILILAFRPQGLLGQMPREKV